MAENKQDTKENINIEIPEDKADGTYSNLAVIAHSSTEFVLDFVNMMPGMPSPKVKARIIIPPIHVKRLMRALGENIERYEASFGTIQDHEQFSFPVPTSGGIQA